MTRNEDRMLSAVREMKHVVDEAVWLLEQDLSTIERNGKPVKETRYLKNLLRELSAVQLLINSKNFNMRRE